MVHAEVETSSRDPYGNYSAINGDLSLKLRDEKPARAIV